MILKLAILCLMSAPAFGIWEKGFKIRFDINPFRIGSSSFIPLPITYTEAISKSWTNVTKPDLPDGYDNIFLMCPKDEYTVCVYYDDTGYVAGLQIAFDPNYCDEVIFDWTEAGFTEWSVTTDGTTTKYWASQQLYISADYLATDAATRVSARDDKYLMQEPYYYVTSFNRSLLAIPRSHSELTSSYYTKQACIPGMGRHYFYNLTADQTCSASTLSTYYPMEYNDQSDAVGLFLPASCKVPTGTKNYFETPSKLEVKAGFPNGPNCFYEYGNSPGVITVHTYFIKDPYLITCIY